MKSDGQWMVGVLAAAAAFTMGCQAEPAPTAPAEHALAAASLGMAVDNLTGSATVFDADTNVVLGTVAGLGAPPLASGDCSIAADGSKAFFTRFNDSVTVVDLTGPTPVQAAAPNPIAIANPGEDTALSPDGKFLVVCDGSAPAPISVIDVATQTQISTFSTGADCNSVDVCSDGSVLVTSFGLAVVRRLTLSASGTLADTGESLSVNAPVNVYCSPSATAGVIVEQVPSDVISVKLPGLTPVSTRPISSFAVTGAINHAGNRFYARNDAGTLTAFTLDQATATLGSTPVFEVAVAPILTFFGIEQLAVHPSDASIYVSEPGALRILDAATGAPVGSIADISLPQPTGVCFGPGVTGNRPPVAKCAARTVLADGTCHAPASIDDGSFDPDAGDAITCTQTPIGPFGRGATLVTLTCSDSHGATASCNAPVTVVDQTPPMVACPAAQTAECNDGQRGAAVSFIVAAPDNCVASAAVVCARPSGSTFPLGTTSDACRASDPDGNASFCSHDVTVVDTAAPVVSPAAVADVWPPFHDYHVVDLADCIESLQDACQGPLDVDTHAQVTCCTSDEPDLGQGNGDLPNDCVIVNKHAVKLRAERAPNGNGRVYTLHYTVTDGANKTTNHTCTVGVPHARVEGPAIDDGAVGGCR